MRLCRRADYEHFADLWQGLHPGAVGADAIDATLHLERLDPATRTQRRHPARLEQLPDGALVLLDGVPWLVLGRQLLRWAPSGYAERRARRGEGEVELITPPSLVAILGEGWHGLVPLLHPSALDR